MFLKNFFTPVYIYHFLLFFSFSVSVNNQIDILYVNIFFYSLSHILIIYLSFYYFHSILFFVFLFYGSLYDIFLINEIGPHLIVFLFLLFFIMSLKKFLFNLSSLKVFYLIFLLILIIYFSEMIIADLFFKYSFNVSDYFLVSAISSITLIPIIFLFSKLDKI